MTLIEFLSHIRSIDVSLWVEDGQLCYSAPPGALTPVLRTELVARKEELLAFLSEASAATGTIRPPIAPISRDGKLLPSFAQQRLWLLDQLAPGNPAYNIPVAVRLTGQLDATVLQQSLNAITQRHEVLRTSFVSVGGSPISMITPTLSVNLPIVDLSDLPTNEQQTEVQRLINEEAQKPFDLAQGPLLRTALLRVKQQEHVLLLTMHHIISDGWSIGITFRELAAFYKAFSTDGRLPLPELPIQYADFAVWQRMWLQGEVLDSQLAYWRQQLAGDLPVLELPLDYARPPIQTYRGASRTLVLSKALSDALKALSSQENVTLFMTLLAAFKTLLYRYTGQTDVIVGSPIAGRNWRETEELIGFFLNTLVLRTDLSGDPIFRELLGRLRKVTLEAYNHQDLPFEKLLEELQPERVLSRTPLFQVFFNMLNIPYDDIELPGLTVELQSPPEVGSKFDLTLYVKERDGEVQLELVYNPDLFSQGRMAEMLRQFEHLLVQVVERPDDKISHYSLISRTAENHLPNPIQVLDSNWEGSVHTRFCRQAQRAPDRLAIVDKHGSWTYGELDARSNQLANYLCDKGIRPQDVVAIYAHRSASLVWAILGVLKAGAAFLILDPTYPVPRLTDCLRIATPRGWIQIKAAGDLPDALEDFVALSYRCRLDLPEQATACSPLMKYSIDNPGVTVGPDNLAYVAFTSGSTGKPKGILGTHRPLSHFLQWHTQTFDLRATDRFSMLSGLSHDPLLRDIFTPLWLGGILCIPDPAHMGNPDWSTRWMKQEEISITHLTPAIGQLLAGSIGEATKNIGKDITLTSLRYAFLGGDVLTKSDVGKIQALAPSVTCVNFYGATETPQAMGYFIIPPQAKIIGSDRCDKEMIPLGRGTEGVQLLVLNSSQQLAGVGEVGEIHVRTPYLAKGYLGDEALTKERFIINPLTRRVDDRLYKTGDLGYYLPDGNIVFRGRNDHQVKIRGFRIELGEIEATLGKHLAAREAVVVAREGAAGDKRLVAYVVPEQGLRPSATELRDFLMGKLPEYMVPSAFVMLECLPLTPNGKVNRAALPAPTGRRPELDTTFIAPRTELERAIATIWQELLQVEKVGRNDSFFELGGHSLLLLQAHDRLQKALKRELSILEMFKYPTISSLAKHLSQERGKALFSQPSEDRIEELEEGKQRLRKRLERVGRQGRRNER